jgi:Ser/Thr protein kinase RdoA (MazF antagonist)
MEAMVKYEVINNGLKQYGLTVCSVKPLNGGIENYIYLIETPGKKFVLKIYRHRTYSEVEHEVRILKNLSIEKTDISYPIPKSTLKGGPISSFGKCPSILYPYISGKIAVFSQQLINDVLDFTTVFKEKNDSVVTNDLKCWDVDTVYALSIMLLKESRWIKQDKSLKQIFLREITLYQAYKNILMQFPTRLIHGDLTRNNLLMAVTGRLKAVIDFDDAYFDSEIIELSTLARAVCFNKQSQFDLKSSKNFYETLCRKQLLSSITFNNFIDVLRYTCFKFIVHILYHDEFVRRTDNFNFFDDYNKYVSLVGIIRKANIDSK